MSLNDDSHIDDDPDTTLLQEIAAQFEIVEYDPGQVIMEQGAYMRRIYILLYSMLRDDDDNVSYLNLFPSCRSTVFTLLRTHNNNTTKANRGSMVLYTTTS